MTDWDTNVAVGGNWASEGDAATLPSTEVLTIKSVMASTNYVTPIDIADIAGNPIPGDDNWALVVDHEAASNIEVDFTAKQSAKPVIQDPEGTFRIYVQARRSSGGGVDPELRVIFRYKLQTAWDETIATIPDINREQGVVHFVDIPWDTFSFNLVFDPALASLIVLGIPGPGPPGPSENTIELGAASMTLDFEGDEAKWIDPNRGNTDWNSGVDPGTPWS